MKDTHTPSRSIRVSDELWKAARQAASARGLTITDVVIASLKALVRQHERSAR